MAPRWRSEGWLAAAAVVVIAAASAAVFAAAWRVPQPDAGTDLAAHRSDEPWRLSVERSPDGAVTAWQSTNWRAVSPLRAKAEWPTPVSDVLFAELGLDFDGGAPMLSDRLALELLRGRALEAVTTTTLGADGSRERATEYHVVDGDGLRVLALDLADGPLLTFDPPLPAMAADLDVGANWSGQGAVGDDGAYAARGEVVDAGAPPEPDAGAGDECRRVRTHLELDVAADAPLTIDSAEWWCPGRGEVAAEVTDAQGRRRTRLLATSGEPLAEPVDAPRPALADPGAPVDLDDGAQWWTLGRDSRAPPTTPPAVVDADDARLLVLAEGAGRLVALSAVGGLASERVWEVVAGGPIRAGPVADADAGLIYAGSTDGRVYAVDAGGAIRWAAPTRDRVVADPLPVDGGVVVAGTDGHLRLLDAGIGRPRWRTDLSAPLLSGPARVGDVIAVGGDDGAVHGVDLTDGERRWRLELGGRVLAAVVNDDGDVIAGSTNGRVAAVDAASGQVRWATDLDGPVESAATVAHGLVLVVDGDDLVALDRADGAPRWRSDEGRLNGPPTPLANGVAVTRRDGAVLALDARGERRGDWPPTAVGDRDPAPVHAPPVGDGDGLWVVDDAGGAGRIGPPLPEPEGP